ncbi:rRNA processing/ribosome biogenesis-domain-containing protein [Phascolomyces articulosus]|uniref:Pre-rRNA-processing protein RIX1 n=1 Tax=Phascolomyces articulosus TaxID=60185 RepID=A0AAD5JWB4_9FUNG|nr:rRNA processing/ribosome biogenesis-domain-containing protein [Phascolomyces articulosus]
MTTQLSRILNDYLVNESHISNYLPFILEAITHNHLLIDQENTNDNDAVVKRKWTVRLNALLGSKQASTRWAAICLIKETCQQSESLYVTSVQTWTAQLLGVLAKPAETNLMISTTIETLSLLFEKTVGKAELHAEVTIKSLPRFNQLLLSLSSQPELMPITLRALSKNTEIFPTMSRHIMDQTLKLYISCLDNANDVPPSILGHCLATACRASVKTNVASQWQDTLMKLIGSIHQALDRLFETVDEEDSVSDRMTGYTLASTPLDYVEAFPILLKRIRYIQDTIASYLSSKTIVPVGVPIAHLIRLCCRIYNVYQGCVMREYKPKDEYACLMTCLPALHLNTNKLLASLLLSADVGMIQYTKLLARILLRLLSENNKKRAVKISVYNLISLCMQKFGYAFADTILKPVVLSAIDNLKAIEHKRVDVVVPDKKVSGKKRRAEQISSDAFSTNDTISYPPCDIQMAALQVLYNVMTLHGNSMDLGLRSSIDTTIVSRILQSTTRNDIKTNNEESLAVKCHLYKCLLSSIMSPNINQATLLPHAARLFSAGLNDETHELRMICTQGLAICDLCMHTRMPPIQRLQPTPSTTTTATSSDTMLATTIEDATNEMDNDNDSNNEEEEEMITEQIEELKTPVSPIMARSSNVIRAPEDDDDEIMQENQRSNIKLAQQPSIPIVAPSASSSSSTTLTTQSIEQDGKKELLFTTKESTFSSTTNTTIPDDDNDMISSSVTETLTTSSPKQQTKIIHQPNQDDDEDDEEFEIPEINMDDD